MKCFWLGVRCEARAFFIRHLDKWDIWGFMDYSVLFEYLHFYTRGL